MKKNITYFSILRKISFGKIVLLLLILLVSGACYAIPIQITSKLVDILSKDSIVLISVVYMILLYFCIRFVASITDFIGKLLTRRISNNISFEMKSEYLVDLLKKDYMNYQDESFGKILSVYSKDIEYVSNAISGPILWFSSSISMLLWSSSVLAYIKYELALMYILFGLLIAIITIIISKKIAAVNKMVSSKNDKRIDTITAICEAFKEIYMFGTSSKEIKNSKAIEREYNDLLFKETRLSGFKTLLNDFLYYLTGALVWFVGSRFIQQNEMSVGDLVAFISFAGLIISPIVRFSGQWTQIKKINISISRINDVLNIPKRLFGRATIDKVRQVSVRNLMFEYPNRFKLRNISFNLKEGHTYSFVGENGSGKSTMVSILSGLYSKYKGSIRFNDADLNTLSHSSIIKSVLAIDSNASFTQSKIIDSIYYTEHKIHIPKNNNIHELIKKLIEHNSDIKNCSAGEKQLIAIARGLIHNPDILIIDEAISSIDFKISNIVINELISYVRAYKKILIIVSHRLTDIKNTDMVYFFKEGEIIDKGKHDYLYLANREYKAFLNKAMSE